MPYLWFSVGSFREKSNEIIATSTYNGRVIQNIMSVRCRRCEEEIDNTNAEIWNHFYSAAFTELSSVTSSWIGFNGSLSASAIDCKLEDLSILRAEAYV